MGTIIHEVLIITAEKGNLMPKFRVIASDITFYRGVVEAESAEAVEAMFGDEDAWEILDLEEYDGEAMTPVLIEEIKE